MQLDWPENKQLSQEVIHSTVIGSWKMAKSNNICDWKRFSIYEYNSTNSLFP